jgi:hypothetical protein
VLLVALVLDDGRARIEAVTSWAGPQAVTECERDLPGWVRRIRPRTLGWFPGGPAAVIAATLKDRAKETGRSWAPRGTRVAEITGEAPAVCMGFAQQVGAGRVLHSGQDLLDVQADHAEKLWTGDRWVFTRRGSGHVDGMYAAAGAVHLARTIPPTPQRTRRVHAGGV